MLRIFFSGSSWMWYVFFVCFASSSNRPAAHTIHSLSHKLNWISGIFFFSLAFFSSSFVDISMRPSFSSFEFPAIPFGQHSLNLNECRLFCHSSFFFLLLPRKIFYEQSHCKHNVNFFTPYGIEPFYTPPQSIVIYGLSKCILIFNFQYIDSFGFIALLLLLLSSQAMANIDEMQCQDFQ